ncbi:ITGB1 family protein [Megaselia abdita]
MTQRIKSSLHFCSLRNLFLTILFVTFVSAQFSEKMTAADPCTSKVNCRDCIQTQHCAWCMSSDFGSDKPRCYQPDHALQTYCEEAFTVNPDTEYHVEINRALTVNQAGMSGGGGTMVSGGSVFANSSSGSSYYGRSSSESGGYSSIKGSSSSSSGGYGSSSSSGGFSSSGGSYSKSEGITQIYPQKVNLKLRVNEPHRIDFSYAQAEDYPVDLYYLMDLSKSMEDDKEKLSTLGDSLATEMRKITSNFNLGFGSFVDKVLMPYVSTVPKNLQEPCSGCAAPYGYHNIMRLSTDTYRFSSEVKSAKVSGNLDAPEGGFDAIMQAIVCRDQIGWRSQARRLLVFSTDAGFHYAGDGKLGGVIAPNDGECHLDNGVYTHSSIQDYPSISQINHKVIEQSINVIFAVTASQIEVYNKLSQHIEGSSSAVLSADSSNVVELIKEEYSKISSVIEMKDNASNDVKITYYSSCLNGGKPVQTSKCSGLKVGQSVEFQAEIVVTKCPENPADWNQLIQIYPVGVNESLSINLTMLCGCGCESEGPMFEKHSPKCKNHGDLKCGICECDNSFFGRHCECSSQDASANTEFGNCRADKNSTIECSAKGTCICGVCECDKRSGNEIFSGKYCECDNFSCDRYAGQICAGPDHGSCVCGKCECKHGWTGGACECPASNDQCMPPGPDAEICSGHGTCECGKCVCKATDDGRFSGKYCEKCPTCSGRCAELKECVQCQMHKNGPLYPDGCAENCTHFSPTGVEKVVIDESKGEYKCVFYDEEDCKFTFKYYENITTGQILVEAEEKRECPPKVFMLGIILMVIGAIVLIGLALLILWKVLTTIHDRREFARFEKERENARWDTGENPIYKQATSTFKNPTYAGK